jgi:hypothetical protein
LLNWLCTSAAAAMMALAVLRAGIGRKRPWPPAC